MQQVKTELNIWENSKESNYQLKNSHKFCGGFHNALKAQRTFFISFIKLYKIGSIKDNLVPIKGNLVVTKGNLVPTKGNLVPIKGNLVPIKGNLVPISRL